MIVYYTLLLIYKYKFDMKVWVKILSVPLFFGFVFFWKGFYNNFLNFLRGDPLVPFLSESYVIGFSRFEGIMSYSMTATVIHESDFQTPLLLGMSYLQSLWLIFIRGSFLKPAETLAESYGSVIAPSVMSQGGGVAFSGVLEAWLNFGVLGPFIIGTLLGGVGKYFDNNRNSVLLPIVLLCFLRYFRSDFASMFKRLIVLNGSMIVVVVTVVYLYQVWYRKKHVG